MNSWRGDQVKDEPPYHYLQTKAANSHLVQGLWDIANSNGEQGRVMAMKVVSSNDGVIMQRTSYP